MNRLKKFLMTDWTIACEMRFLQIHRCVKRNSNIAWDYVNYGPYRSLYVNHDCNQIADCIVYYKKEILVWNGCLSPLPPLPLPILMRILKQYAVIEYVCWINLPRRKEEKNKGSVRLLMVGLTSDFSVKYKRKSYACIRSIHRRRREHF